MAVYDDPKFNEEDAESSAKIVNIMTEVSARHSIDVGPAWTSHVVILCRQIQSLGSPPPEIMGPIPGADGAPPLPENCIVA
jgi:hypothetical protein